MAVLGHDPRLATPRERHGLVEAFEELHGLPALSESRERLLRALSKKQLSTADVIAAIESDIALVIGTLRFANRIDSARRNRIASLPLAVEVLNPKRLELITRRVPVVDFFEPAPRWGIAPDLVRRHAVATQRLADRLWSEVEGVDREELSVAALLHDVGKLVLAVAFPSYADSLRSAGSTPEERLTDERKRFGVDHAIVGGAVVRRWELPNRLADAVGQHHEPDSPMAAMVRLADMLVHYAHGGVIDPSELERAAARVELQPEALRSLMQELPGDSGASRVLEPCPLTRMELAVLRELSEGKTYDEIADDLQRSASTVRTHLHSCYRKLAVRDRAQAVLLAADRGWL